MDIRQLTFDRQAQFASGLADLAAFAPNWVLVFAAPGWFASADFFPALRAAFPQARLSGCSTAGEVGNEGVSNGGCVVTALRMARVPDFAVTAVAGAADSYAAGTRLAQGLQAAGPQAVLLLAPGVNINGSALVDGVSAGLPGVAVVGGLAGDDGAFAQTWTLSDGGVSAHAALALALPTDLCVGHGSFGGWKPFGPTRKVTRAQDNVLYALDHEPALTVYKRYLGEYAADLPASGLLFPFEMLDAEHASVGLIRTILGVNEADGSLTLAGDIDPQGYLRLMHASTDMLLDGAEVAATSMQQTLLNPASGGLALLVSCIGRKLVMGGRVDEEVCAVREVIGRNVTVTGFYSYGEIGVSQASTFSRLHSPHATCRCNALGSEHLSGLHNQTMNIIYLCDPAQDTLPATQASAAVSDPQIAWMAAKNHLLRRQVKRQLGVSEADVLPVLDELRTLSEQPTVSAPARHVMCQLGELLTAVSTAYDQSDRNLELRSRSLELSSSELMSANQRLMNQAGRLAQEVKKATAEIFAREKESIFRLSKAAEFRDPETGAHILRMAHYSALIARRLGWDDDAVDLILQAAPMHDVGKLGTPDYILLKPAMLTTDEFEVMKRHTLVGWEILKGSASPMLQLAAEIALSHHEKYDGSGYPHGLAGEAIPLSGRIVAVADVFDALTSARPYKRAWEIERAFALLQENRGNHFDPACVDAFLAEIDAVLAIRTQYLDEPA